MAENVDAEQKVSQTAVALLSVVLSLAMQAMAKRAKQAEIELRQAEQDRIQAQRQLAAERETAAILWQRIDDPAWVRDRPDQVAQAWASAHAWTPVDPRAAEASAKFDFLLDGLYGRGSVPVNVSRETADFRAMATLLNNAVRSASEKPAEARYFELVPAAERESWLERQVWGPGSDPETRVAASSQLADLHRGLPVGVMREMSAESRHAWIKFYKEMSPEERRAWRHGWLLRQMWGPGIPDNVRVERAAEMMWAHTRSDRYLEPEAWYAWTAEFQTRIRDERERQQRSQQRPNKSATPLPSLPIENNASVPEAAVPNLMSMPTSPGVTRAAAPNQRPAASDSARTTTSESTEQRRDRMAKTVAAEWPADLAQAITSSPAFGAFTTSLHELELRGYTTAGILSQLPAQKLLGHDFYNQPVRDSAAFAHYLVKQLSQSLPAKASAAASAKQLSRTIQQREAPEHGEAGGKADVAKAAKRPARAQAEASTGKTQPQPRKRAKRRSTSSSAPQDRSKATPASGPSRSDQQTSQSPSSPPAAGREPDKAQPNASTDASKRIMVHTRARRDHQVMTKSGVARLLRAMAPTSPEFIALANSAYGQDDELDALIAQRNPDLAPNLIIGFDADGTARMASKHGAAEAINAIEPDSPAEQDQDMLWLLLGRNPELDHLIEQRHPAFSRRAEAQRTAQSDRAEGNHTAAPSKQPDAAANIPTRTDSRPARVRPAPSASAYQTTADAGEPASRVANPAGTIPGAHSTVTPSSASNAHSRTQPVAPEPTSEPALAGTAARDDQGEERLIAYWQDEQRNLSWMTKSEARKLIDALDPVDGRSPVRGGAVSYVVGQRMLGRIYGQDPELDALITARHRHIGNVVKLGGPSEKVPQMPTHPRGAKNDAAPTLGAKPSQEPAKSIHRAETVGPSLSTAERPPDQNYPTPLPTALGNEDLKAKQRNDAIKAAQLGARPAHLRRSVPAVDRSTVRPIG